MSLTTSERRKLARLSLAGLSVGDAFGQQFVSQPELLHRRELPMFPWKYTDDTVMGIAVTQTLEQFGEIDQSDLANRFATYHREDPHRGYGATAQEILHRISDGEPWRDVSSSVFSGSGSMGNGAAMRAAPIGAWFFDDPQYVASQAKLSAEVTHMHADGQAGAIAVATAAAFACRWQIDGTVHQNANTLISCVLPFVPDSKTRLGLVLAAELKPQTTHAEAATQLGNGKQVISSDTVPFCLWSAQQSLSNYTDALWQTASVFGDIDTNCAIVGSIVSVACGHNCIPNEWLLSREGLGW